MVEIMDEAVIVDLNLQNAGLYFVIFGIMILSTYQMLKPIWRENRKKEDSSKPWDWKDVYLPLIAGIVITLQFYPTTIFTYLDFRPNNEVANVLLSTVVVSMSAYLGYDSGRWVADFIVSLIGRVRLKSGPGGF